MNFNPLNQILSMQWQIWLCCWNFEDLRRLHPNTIRTLSLKGDPPIELIKLRSGGGGNRCRRETPATFSQEILRRVRCLLWGLNGKSLKDPKSRSHLGILCLQWTVGLAQTLPGCRSSWHYLWSRPQTSLGRNWFQLLVPRILHFELNPSTINEGDTPARQELLQLNSFITEGVAVSLLQMNRLFHLSISRSLLAS